MTTRDVRSVGERLLACDVHARELLLEPDRLEAAALVRAWPELVQAAHELVAVTEMPHMSAQHVGLGDSVLAERLRLVSDGLHSQLAKRSWPGPGPGEPRILSLADEFVGIHDRIERVWRTPRIRHAEVYADVSALRARVLHTVYVATHAVGLAVALEIRNPRVRVGARGRRAERMSALRYCRGRLEIAERLVAAEVYRVFPAALAGQHRPSPAPERIARALARWDVETHRSLAHDPVLATLLSVSRVQAAVSALTRAVLSAADESAHFDAVTYRMQADPQLAAVGAAWSTLHADLRELTPVRERSTSEALASSGAELVAAFVDLLGTGGEGSAQGVATNRISPSVTTALAGSLASHGDVATVISDVLTSGDLKVRARMTRAFVNTHAELGGSESPRAALLMPEDLAADRMASMPHPVRALLSRRAEHVRRIADGLSTVPLSHRELRPSEDLVIPHRARRPAVVREPSRGPVEAMSL